MPQTPDVAMLLELAVEHADGAAAVVRDGARGVGVDAVRVGAKSTPTDLVTQVDRRSEQWLVDQLHERRPDDGVLGEEGAERASSSGVRWIVDPIDGTVNFVLGIPAYSVSVAAELDGRVVAGAVVNPVSGEVFRAGVGLGAFLGDVRLEGPRDVALSRAVIGTGFSYDAKRRGRQAAVVAQLLPLVGDIRRIGSAALDLCYVAAGRLDGYYEVGLNPWDHAAGVLIATEAGCVVDGVAGSPMVAVAGPSLAADLFALLGRLDAVGVLDDGYRG